MCVVLAPLCVDAAAPDLVQLQGVLTTVGGQPAPDGPYGLTVGLYSAQTGGDLLHEETFGGAKSAVVENGRFDLVVGTVSDLPADLFGAAEDVWLQLQVELDAPLPRRRLFSVPYAISARHALTADAVTFDVATQAELDAALDGLITASDVADQVSALADLVYTKTEVDDAVKVALSTVYSKAQVDSAISTGLATLYTMAEVDSAIAAVDGKLSGYLPLSGGILTGPLTAGGSVTVADDAAECTAANAGAIRFAESAFEGCDGSKWILLGSGTPVPSGTLIFTAVVGNNEDGKVIGTIPAVAGKKIRVIRVAICGDADASSGPAIYRVTGGGVDFTWAAGQNNPGPTYFIGSTPVVSGGARGFVYKTISELTSQAGAALTVKMDAQNDHDALFCQASDEDGNPYSDASGTSRGWVKYQYE